MVLVQPGKARIQSGESSDGLGWEVAEWEPSLDLRPYIRELQGYLETTPAPLTRRELPGARVVVILEFGPPIQVFGERGQASSSTFQGGFVAGLDDGCTFTRHDGRQRGIQINLTPIAARLFFDVPASELSGQVIPFTDLVPEHRLVCERLAELEQWDDRFELIEDMLRKRIARSGADRRKVAAVDWFCRALEGGATEIGVLADRLDYSHKHVLTLFRRYVGHTPGMLARLHRFERLTRDIKTAMDVNWADLALKHGYHDQSHLSRDTRRFAGTTPGKLRQEFRNPLEG